MGHPRERHGKCWHLRMSSLQALRPRAGQVREPQAPPRKVNQGVRSFILLDGLLVHEKAIDQAASLRHGEFFVCPSGGYLRYHRSCNGAPLIAEGHGRYDGRALLGIQLDERTDPLRTQQSGCCKSESWRPSKSHLHRGLPGAASSGDSERAPPNEDRSTIAVV
jgi:hypothetical protein